MIWYIVAVLGDGLGARKWRKVAEMGRLHLPAADVHGHVHLSLQP
jgi:hypothetical protein